jgi:signal peptidase I
MRKVFLIPLLIAGVLLILFIVGRVTGILEYHKAVSTSMLPTLEPGEHFFSSRLSKPERNDLAVFNHMAGINEVQVAPGTIQRFVFRLVALAGDTVRIINNYAYVNGKFVDDSMKLNFFYEVPALRAEEALELIDPDHPVKTEDRILNIYNGMALLNISPGEAALIRSTIPVTKKTDTTYNEYLFYPKKGLRWSVSNYGPVKIPTGHCFFLGDNRENAMDSRFIGPVPVRDITGKVLIKR